MSNITPIDALLSLGEKEVISDGIPTNADEFAVMCYRLDNVEITATWEQVVSKMSELEAEYDAQEYARNRKDEYPSIGDQLDALFHAGLFDSDMTAKIQAVKDKYPKE